MNYIGINEVTKMVKRCRATVETWIEAGHFITPVVFGKSKTSARYWLKEDVEAWIAKNREWLANRKRAA